MDLIRLEDFLIVDLMRWEILLGEDLKQDRMVTTKASTQWQTMPIRDLILSGTLAIEGMIPKVTSIDKDLAR